MSESARRFTVIGSVDASSFAEVEAATPEEALEKAGKKLHASVCCNCSERLDVGDWTKFTVLDESGEAVLEVDI
jgi:hypothetical protein